MCHHFNRTTLKKNKKNNYHHFLQLLVFGIKNTTSQHLNA